MSDLRRSANPGRTFSPNNSCRRKQWFRSYDLAKRAAGNMIRMNKEDEGDLEPYSCKYCGRYHVGHRVIHT
jgi:hypothetical protein